MNKRILIIEDNSDNLELIVSLLTHYGCTTLVATDGDQGLAIAKQETPDLIICATELSKLNGYKMVKQFKEDEKLKNIPLIALSDFLDEAARKEATAAGFTSCINTPLDSKIFITQVKELLKWEVGIYTILVVDDFAINRIFFSTVLKKVGRILQAADGVEALKIAQDEHPDLIISDIQMPNMDGYELVKALQADATLATIPVIFYSALYRLEEAELADIPGVQKILPKPSSIQVIRETVNSFIKKTPFVTGKEQASEPEVNSLMDSKLFTLFEFNLDLMTERNQTKLLRLFVNGACKMVESKYCVIGIFEEKKDVFKYYLVSENGRPWKFKDDLILPSHEFVQKILNNRVPLKLNYINEKAKEHLPLFPPMTSCLGLPVRSASDLYGFLYFADKVDNTLFNDVDVELATALAAQIAILFENIELYDIVQKLLESRKNLNHDSV